MNKLKLPMARRLTLSGLVIMFMAIILMFIYGEQATLYIMAGIGMFIYGLGVIMSPKQKAHVVVMKGKRERVLF